VHRWILVTLLLPLALPGCYTWRPVEHPRPGSDVRVRLNAEAAVRRSEGRDEPVVFLDGRVVREDADRLTLDVLIARDVSQFRNVELRDTVLVGHGEVQSILARELSTTRSLVFAGAMGVAAFAIVSGINAIAGGNEGEPDPGNQAAIVPVAGIRFGGSGFRLVVPFR
jgi:hypothetical protein